MAVRAQHSDSWGTLFLGEHLGSGCLFAALGALALLGQQPGLRGVLRVARVQRRFERVQVRRAPATKTGSFRVTGSCRSTT